MPEQDLNSLGDAKTRTGENADDTAESTAQEAGGFFQRMIEQIKDTFTSPGHNVGASVPSTPGNVTYRADDKVSYAAPSGESTVSSAINTAPLPADNTLPGASNMTNATDSAATATGKAVTRL
jgi:hypothetical protein